MPSQEKPGEKAREGPFSKQKFLVKSREINDFSSPFHVKLHLAGWAAVFSRENTRIRSKKEKNKFTWSGPGESG